jgi:hypothetical protein
MRQFFGIAREPEFSPGRVHDDRAILDLVAAHLRGLGHATTVFRAGDDCWPEPPDDAVVFTMAQGARAVHHLQRWHARGVRVVNRPEGILNCQRHRTLVAFAAAGARIPFPESLILDAGAPPALPAWIDTGAWVKRGDVHATAADDVVYVESRSAALEALEHFRERGIGQAVIQRHVAGRVMKFYGVLGKFFYCVRPPQVSEPSPDLLDRMDALGQRAARALGVEIYGGDCVFGLDGEISLIDLNDWPSYAPCRVQAATAIAAYLLAQETTT